MPNCWKTLAVWKYNCNGPEPVQLGAVIRPLVVMSERYCLLQSLLVNGNLRIARQHIVLQRFWGNSVLRNDTDVHHPVTRKNEGQRRA